MSMKNANRSWKEIVAEIGGAKKDIIARYKGLSNTSSNKKDDKVEEPRVVEVTGDDDGFGGFGILGDWGDETITVEVTEKGKKGGKDKNKGGSKRSSHGSNRITPNPTPSSPPPPTSNNKNELEPELLCDCADCTTERQQQAKKTHRVSFSNDVNTNPPRNTTQPESHQQRQNNTWGGSNVQDDNYTPGGYGQRDLYEGKLRPNHIWTREDCEILEELERRYKDNKWLQVQAGFFNWTGRMVDGEVIRGKFQVDGVI
jgi:hypothetical protein